MKTIKKVPVEPVYVEYLPAVSDMAEQKIYISKRFETSGHRCLCGCGLLTILPFDEHGWDLTEKNDKITISPSVGNHQYPCKSHYIIRNNVANFV